MSETKQEFFSSRWALIIATIGIAVGTGNIWRFSRIVAQNGGGSFLIPWVIFLLIWSAIVATDITAFTLSKAESIGADNTINVVETPDGLTAYTADKGHFDVLFECSGVASALAAAVPALRPGATVVQLGLGGDMTLPMQAMTAKELVLKGSFRFHHEFPLAVQMMQAGRIDVKRLLTQTLPLASSMRFEGLMSRWITPRLCA